MTAPQPPQPTTAPSTGPSTAPSGQPGSPGATPSPAWNAKPRSADQPADDGLPPSSLPFDAPPTVTASADNDFDSAYRRNLTDRQQGIKPTAPGSEGAAAGPGTPATLPGTPALGAPGALTVAPEDLSSFGLKVAGIHNDHFVPGKPADPSTAEQITDVTKAFGPLGDNAGITTAYGNFRTQVLQVLQEIQGLLGQLPDDVRRASGTYEGLDASIASAMRSLGVQQ